MKIKNVLLCAMFFYISYAFSQEAKKGYYIDNRQNRIEGLFKMEDYPNTKVLEFKTNENERFTQLNIADIQEYGIEEDFKFVRETVKHDASYHKDISLSKDPQWTTESVLLNVLIEGDVPLYSYNDGNVTKFFYRKPENGKITQLVYKKFHLNDIAPVEENNFYRTQIFTDLKCYSVTLTDINALQYSKNSLKAIFKKIADCKETAYVVYDNKTYKKAKILFSVFAGVNSSKFAVDLSSNGTSEATSEITPNFGAEVALKMPSGKLDFFMRLEYEKFSGISIHKRQATSLQYTSFELQSAFMNLYVGPRFNFGNQNKFFVDGALGVAFPMNGDIERKIYYPESPTSGVNTESFETASTTFFSIGAGYNITRKFGIEFKFVTNRDIFANPIYSSRFSRYGVNLKYTLN